MFMTSGMICQQNIDKIRRIFNRKFLHQIPLLEHFLAEALPLLKVVSAPTNETGDEVLLRVISFVTIPVTGLASFIKEIRLIRMYKPAASNHKPKTVAMMKFVILEDVCSTCFAPCCS
jgi:hypothetical protein